MVGKAIGKAVDVSRSVGNAAENDFVQESILQTLGKASEEIGEAVIDESNE